MCCLLRRRSRCSRRGTRHSSNRLWTPTAWTKVERRQSGLEMDWTVLESGLDWTGLEAGQLAARTVDSAGFKLGGTPAVSGVRSRRQASEPIDRRSWPAGPNCIVWCELSAGLYNGSRGLGLDSQDVSNGWNGRPEGASATRDCGGGPTGRSSLTAPLRAGEGWAAKDLSPLVRIPSQATVDATWITSQ